MNWGQYEISIYIKKPGNESQPGLCASGWRDLYYHFRDIRSEYFVGGVWSKITDKFLVGAGSTYTLGATGGEATHTLTENEMPSHNHSYENGGSAVTIYANQNVLFTVGFALGTNTSGAWYGANKSIGSINNKGGGQAHNNMPPYQAVYMWQRTA